jgi:hypothetical protein
VESTRFGGPGSSSHNIEVQIENTAIVDAGWSRGELTTWRHNRLLPSDAARAPRRVIIIEGSFGAIVISEHGGRFRRERKMRIFGWVAVGTAALLLIAGRAHGIDIVPTFVDGAGQTWDSSKRAVIDQAISDWDARILNNETIPVTFDFTNAGTSSYLGLWQGNYTLSVGTNIYPWTSGVQQVVHFNADQMDSSQPNYLLFTLGSIPFANWDALSVARHELGHMLGFTDQFYVDDFSEAGQTDKWSSHIVGTTFDPGGLNVQLAAADNLSHTADSGSTANDLMNPALPNGLRRTISANDQGMLEEAYRYQMAPDPNADGVVNFSDLLTLAQHYGQTNANFTQGDFNGDGTVNFSDLLILAQHYGQTLASGPGLASFVSVPEPVALGVVAWACAVVFRRRETSQKARMAANPKMPAIRIGPAA